MEGGAGDTSDELSSIPSYDRGPGLGPGRHGSATAKRLAEEAGHLGTDADELMIFDGTSDLDGLGDLDINEHDRGASRTEMGGNHEGLDGEVRDQQSYFSSQQSDSIDSDRLAALQDAIT
jgi:hypothetical protein